MSFWNTYGANKLNLVETAGFPELQNIPTQQITLREAARNQSVVGVASGRQTRCICKGTCLDSRCSCRQSRDVYCHKTSSNCQNYVLCLKDHNKAFYHYFLIRGK